MPGVAKLIAPQSWGAKLGLGHIHTEHQVTIQLPHNKIIYEFLFSKSSFLLTFILLQASET